ncbi:hypothetical protein KVP09_12705 [Alcaligenaceae bacterium CGII-47]|nr:hypothetical protein [Alcaligenaceae bacterium CGII-47]
MNMKVLLIAPITALLLGVGGAGMAATTSSDGATGTKHGSGMMMENGAGAQMGQMKPKRMQDHGMMGGGMMEMMGSCPMMGANSGANSKVMMQMHGEMMRAMGDIMIKYADKLEVPSSPQ